MVFLGLTATPGRADGTSLDRVFDCIAYERNIFQGIADGYLVPPVGYEIKLNIDLRVVPTVTEKNGEPTFKKAPLSKVMNQPKVRMEVADGYLQYGQGRKMIGFAVDVAHAHALAETFVQKGIPSKAIDGTMRDNVRAGLLKEFVEGAIRVLWCCDVLTEGYDDPSAQGVIHARPTQSQTFYVQGIGRALRPHPSKQDALILDCVGNSSKHQLAQLASIAGLEMPSSEETRESGPREDVLLSEANVNGHNAIEINFRNLVRRKKTKWAWRETKFGWAVNLPNVGYFLVSWTDHTKTSANIQFHDMRAGKRANKPVYMNRTPLDFQMAYGLVETELDRMFRARGSQARMNDEQTVDTSPMPPEVADVLREAAEQGDLFGAELLKSNAAWRDRTTTWKQRELLESLGVGIEHIPEKAGEAADLTTVMMIEKNARQREPVTDKQRVFILRQKLATEDEIELMTKKQAEGLIVPFLKQLEAKRALARKMEENDDH